MPNLLIVDVDIRSSVPCPYADPEMTDLLDELYLNSGEALTPRWEPVHVEIGDDRDRPGGLTDFLVTVPFCMVSRRFVDLLHQFHCEFEALPLDTRYRRKRLPNEYFALNGLRVVRNAVDVEESKVGTYFHDAGIACDVERLVLNEGATGDAPLVFLKEITKFAVSAKMAKAIVDARLTGVRLLKPEEFRSLP